MTSFLLENSRVPVLVALAAGLVLSTDVGCGRATLGDPFGSTSASSGVGGATSSNSAVSNSTATTTNSTSTGVVCNCQAFCASLSACGVGGPNCIGSCEQGVDPELMQCACDAPNCDELFACANMSSTAVTATSTGTGGGGGFSPECGDCANNAVNQQCVFEVNQCGNNPACIDIIDCMGVCGYGPGCESQCVQGPPQAVNAFYGLIDCAICQACFGPCSTSDVVNLCFDAGG